MRKSITSETARTIIKKHAPRDCDRLLGSELLGLPEVTAHRLHMKTTIMKAFAVVLLGSCSCALLNQGTKEQIAATSEPSGATATLSDGRTYLTPFSRNDSTQDLQIHFAKSGYQSTEVTDESHVEGIMENANEVPCLEVI
jgi:hypothetical protein